MVRIVGHHYGNVVWQSFDKCMSFIKKKKRRKSVPHLNVCILLHLNSSHGDCIDCKVLSNRKCQCMMCLSCDVYPISNWYYATWNALTMKKKKMSRKKTRNLMSMIFRHINPLYIILSLRHRPFYLKKIYIISPDERDKKKTRRIL